VSSVNNSTVINILSTFVYFLDNELFRTQDLYPTDWI